MAILAHEEGIAGRCRIYATDLSEVVLFNGGGRATPGATPELQAAEAGARARQAASVFAPFQCIRSAVWVSSNMIGRSHASIITGISVLLRSASVASARTQRETTDLCDHSTTTALAVFSAVSVTSS